MFIKLAARSFTKAMTSRLFRGGMALVWGLSVSASFADNPPDIDDFMLEFKRAYQERNVDLYKSLCAASFTNTKEYNLNVEQIANGNVKRVFFPDQDIDVKIGQSEAYVRYVPITIVENDPSQPIYRRKMISLIRVGGIWKIKDDRLDTRTPEQIQAEASSYPEVSRDTAYKILQIIERWRVAWESEDLNTYMSFYASDAQIIRVRVYGGKEYRHRLTETALRDTMEQLNKQYRWIRIKIAGMEFRKNSDIVVTAQFVQEFKAGVQQDNVTYSDLGFKRLIFSLRGEEWKIAFEDWRMYEQVPQYENLPKQLH